ncbi:1-acylglycerol-3-phosphate O-acyltransferase [Lambiella insularis]|nr:1-acylglycerol-3-phosphate O-acyltransferase [Lambiella insularis]
MHLLLSLLLQFLTAYLILTLSLFLLSLTTAYPPFSFLARLFASYAALTLCAIYGVLASLLLRLFSAQHSAQHATARAFAHTMALFTGVRFEILAGRPHLDTRPAVFVGNHQTALDVLLLGEIFPTHCSVTAKKSLKTVPFLGWFMALSGTVFIDRADRATALKAFEGAAREMREKRQSVFIFPEGTRSNAETPLLLPFKKGAFHLAIQAKVPIVPVVASCYWGVLGAREGRFRAGRIPVVGKQAYSTPFPPAFQCPISHHGPVTDICPPAVLHPIPTAHLAPADVEDLTRHTRDVMLDALRRLTASPRGQHAALPSLQPFTTPTPALASLEDVYAEGKPTGREDGVLATGAGKEGLQRDVGPQGGESSSVAG